MTYWEVQPKNNKYEYWLEQPPYSPIPGDHLSCAPQYRLQFVVLPVDRPPTIHKVWMEPCEPAFGYIDTVCSDHFDHPFYLLLTKIVMFTTIIF